MLKIGVKGTAGSYKQIFFTLGLQDKKYFCKDKFTLVSTDSQITLAPNEG